YCATSKKNTPSVIDTIHRELHSLLEKGFDDEEILAAKEHICGEEIINGSDMEHRMKILARNYYMQFRQCTNDEMIYDIRSVCTEKIYDVLRRLIKTEHEALLIYGPPLKSKIEKQIKNNFTAHTAIS
ncbi:MAG: insulinase family protein, partial [Spirochaetales bacterium]